jgi:hypothetical protein
VKKLFGELFEPYGPIKAKVSDAPDLMKQDDLPSGDLKSFVGAGKVRYAIRLLPTSVV